MKLIYRIITIVITFYASIANASLITHEAVVNPYQVCFVGESCTDVTMIENGDLEAYADDFFSAVGLDIRFGTINTINYDLATGEYIGDRLIDYPFEAGLGGDFYSFTEIPAFFEFAPSDPALGVGWLGEAGLVVNLTSTYVDNMVTFIHELGHNLGLDHYFDFGVGATDNFMDYSPCAYECTIADIQITQLRTAFEQNTFAFVHEIKGPDSDPTKVSEPYSFFLISMALMLMTLFRQFFVRKRQNEFVAA